MSKGCFKIVDKEKDEWQLCSGDGSCPKDWKEAIDTMLGKTTFDPCPEDNDNAILVIQPQIVIPIEAPNCKYDWNYNFHGQNWVCNCNEGLEQSPLDLPAAKSLDILPYPFFILAKTLFLTTETFRNKI